MRLIGFLPFAEPQSVFVRCNSSLEAPMFRVAFECVPYPDCRTHPRTSLSGIAYYYAFPREHWRSLRTNNPLERILREVRQKTRVVGAFPDGKSALMPESVRLRHVAGANWGMRRYLEMNRLAQASEAP
jgi:transposase-like protein